MSVYQITQEEIDSVSARQFASQLPYFRDVVIIDGVIIKNRDGKSGGKIGWGLYIWDEEAL